eukprot:132487_1
MQMIFDIIGTPKEEEIEKISDPKAKKHLYGLPTKKKKNLKKTYPGCPPQGIELLFLLLRFDVPKRFTVDQALGHAYLEPVRDPTHERSLACELDFKFEDHQLSTDNLR